MKESIDRQAVLPYTKLKNALSCHLDELSDLLWFPFRTS